MFIGLATYSLKRTTVVFSFLVTSYYAEKISTKLAARSS
jgi:hypothetical protein